MPALVKDPITTYIPGNPGNPGSPYVPAQPARTVVEKQTSCTSGYETVIIQDDDGQVYFFQNSTGQVCTVKDVLVYYPATSAIPAVPYSPPTAAQISLSLNEGWNSYARSINPLPAGSLVEFTVKPGSRGALVAVGAPGMEGVPIDLFAHGIMVDTTGIYVFEAGAVVAQLAAVNLTGTKIRILRLLDGRIAYVVGSAVVFSATPTDVFGTRHVYGMLYAAYDEVSSTEILTGAAVAEPSVVMSGAGEFTMKPEVRALMAGAGDFLVSVNGPAVVMAGAGDFIATLSQAAEIGETTMSGAGAFTATLEAGGNGFVTLEALQAFASDSESSAYGAGDTTLPAMTVSASGGSFIPAQPTNGYVNLPFMVAWGEGVEISAGDGYTTLPLFVAQASEGEYGIGNASLPLMRTYAYGGFLADDEFEIMSAVVARSLHTAAIDLVLVLNSAGELASSFTMTRAQALELLSELGQSDSFGMLGVYGYALLSGLRGLSMETLSVGGRPDLHEGGVVWVVNADTQASSQYDGYGFNSFFTRDGVCYGVAADGIYRLEGSNDAGQQVDALAYIGALDLASALQKLLPTAYVAASSSGQMQLEVDADGTIYLYDARSSEDGTFRNHRIDLGRGIKANMLGLTLKNKDGADFRIASVDMLATTGGRRI